MTTDPIVTALAEHELAGVYGGTATGSTWDCSCGASQTTPGGRDYAALAHRHHVADRIREALQAEAYVTTGAGRPMGDQERADMREWLATRPLARGGPVHD
ncbi:MAG: hypothetical protein J0H73_11755 [Salana multivorans]|nr:hypothetical protein [Salana multivorans]